MTPNHSPSLACGPAAAALYLTVTSAQALTRAGFDASRHTWNVLTTGDLGWVQRTNLVVVGVLVVFFAVGVGRALGPGWGGRWTARLLALYGVGHHVVGGLFAADPQPGFPPGVPPESTWHGAVHFAVRGGGYAVLFAAGLVLARWYAREGRWRSWLALAVVPPLVSGIAHEVLADSATPTGVFVVLTLAPTWVWLVVLGVRLNRPVTAAPVERPVWTVQGR